MSDQSFSVITSLRYDSVAPYSAPENTGPTDFYRLHAHVQRLERSVEAVGWRFNEQNTWGRSENRLLWIAELIRQAADRAKGLGEDSITISETELAESAFVDAHNRGDQSWRVSHIAITLSNPKQD